MNILELMNKLATLHMDYITVRREGRYANTPEGTLEFLQDMEGDLSTLAQECCDAATVLEGQGAGGEGGHD